MIHRERILTTAVAAATLLLALAAAAAAAPVPSTVLVDRPTGFGALPFDGVSGASLRTHALSADGRYLVFSSSNDVLLAADEDSAESVYRLDRSNGAIAQVNLTAAGGQPSAGSFSSAASISADGRYVEFESDDAKLVPGGPAEGFYVKDMQTGAVTLASRAENGVDGAAASRPEFAVVSGDGRHVAFTASGVLHADNADGIQSASDVYVRNLDAASTHMVSVTPAGGEAGASELVAPDIDFAGTAVAFITSARLSADDTDDADDAYVRTGIGAQTETTRFVSFTSHQTPGADTAAEVALSGEGSLVAWSNGNNGVGSELGRSIFMASLLPAVAPARQIDVPRPGGFGSGSGDPAFEPVANADQFPARLYFRSEARLDPADTNDGADLYAADVAHPGDGNFVHLETSGKANGPVDAGAGAAGTVVAFASSASSLPGADGVRAQVFVHDGATDLDVSQPAGVPARTSPAGSSFLGLGHALSDDGRTVAFDAGAPVFGSVPATRRVDFRDQALVRDVVSGQTTLVSAAPDGSPANDDAQDVSIDAAGDRVAFVSQATNLVTDPNPDRRPHAYIADLATGVLTLVDRTAAGAPLRDGIRDAMISPDGRHLVYDSSSPDAPQVAANDSNQHIYVVDLDQGTTALADRATDGTPANGSAFNFDVNGDGSRVAFESAATNLGVTGADEPQIYVRDLVKSTTTWASVPEDTNPLHADPGDLSLSRDGARVAFDQFSPQFGHGMTGSGQVFVRDLNASTTTLASGAAGAAIAELPSLSADGSRVTFTTNFDQDFPVIPQVFLSDLRAGTTTLVSVRRDGSGPARLGATESSISGNGACVAFNSPSDDLVSPGYGPDFSHVFIRGVAAGCSAGFSDAGTTGGGPPAGGAGGGGGPKRDTTAPRISGARLTHGRFSVASARTAVFAVARPKPHRASAPRGTTFVFSLSEPARTTIAITRRAEGRRERRHCVAPRRGLTRRCTRTVAVLTLVRAGTRAGCNRVAFTGRAGRERLAPGRYSAQIVARDRAGNRSKPVNLAFTVVGR